MLSNVFSLKQNSALEMVYSQKKKKKKKGLNAKTSVFDMHMVYGKYHAHCLQKHL